MHLAPGRLGPLQFLLLRRSIQPIRQIVQGMSSGQSRRVHQILAQRALVSLKDFFYVQLYLHLCTSPDSCENIPYFPELRKSATIPRGVPKQIVVCGNLIVSEVVVVVPYGKVRSADEVQIITQMDEIEREATGDSVHG